MPLTLTIPELLPKARVIISYTDGSRRHRLGVIEVSHDGTTIRARKPGGAYVEADPILGEESLGQDAWRIQVGETATHPAGSWAIIVQGCGCGG